MNLRDLKYLQALAQHGHFGRAAEACHVSQPTLSTQLRKLEEYLGVQLVERSSRSVRLTEAGQDIALRAAQITRAADDLVEFARSFRNPLAGPLTVGLIPTLGPYLLPEIIAPMRNALPEVDWRLQELQTPVLLEQILDGQVDLGLMALPVPMRGLDMAELFVEPFVLALPSGHALAEQTEIASADLPHEQLLLLAEGHCLRDQALEVCAMAGVPERRDFKGTSLETLRHMVIAGAGVTLLPALAAKPETALVLRRFSGEPPARRIGLLWRKGSVRAEAAQALAQVIRKALQPRFALL